MPKKSANHAYADLPALERLLLLIATFVQHPGIGCPDPIIGSAGDHNALNAVQAKLREVAQQYDVTLKHDSVHTLRKDIGILRRYGILREPMYRWGYYLGTGVMNWAELRIALNAMHSQAKYQQDHQVSRIYHDVMRRLGSIELGEALFYPVRTSINQAIIYTDPEEMMHQGKYRHTLFEYLDKVESAIVQGQAIEIHRARITHKTGKVGYFQVYPLQLVYADHAWYLLYEECESGFLAFRRFDRFEGHCQEIRGHQRSLVQQSESLQIAHQLRQQGWGLYLGQPDEQKLEREGKLDFVPVIVRFFDESIPFILEGERRHPHQKIVRGPKAKQGGLQYVDYHINLPPRSLKEFSFWVYKHLDEAQYIAPEDLAQKHHQAAQKLIARWAKSSGAM